MIMASTVEVPAVTKLLKSARGKSEPASVAMFFRVRSVGDSQIGSNNRFSGRKARMKAQMIGRSAKKRKPSIIATPSACFQLKG